eukprot:TRINITY_DN3710_c0_g1_i2.p1 TRINITY_DN3710_c0_g1~~TRINITY_DN3710_c0_g1_i2.p1  ORF type:complete len:337 (+),score=64.81 TRINITY_DN3710_c0_g1_i2:766-1776(+)
MERTYAVGTHGTRVDSGAACELCTPVHLLMQTPTAERLPPMHAPFMRNRHSSHRHVMVLQQSRIDRLARVFYGDALRMSLGSMREDTYFDVIIVVPAACCCRNMLHICKREGAKSPDLWATVLSHLVSRARGSAADFKASCDEIQEVLGLLAHEQALPPLEVLDILRENPDLPLWVARDYLTGHVSHTAKELSRHEADINDLRRSTAQMRREMAVLRTSAGVQSGGTGLVPDYGGSTATSPAGDGGAEDAALPACLPLSPIPSQMPAAVLGSGGGSAAMSGEHAKYVDIKRAQAQRAGDHEQFYKDLEEATDGFAQVAACFGKGLIGGITSSAAPP